MYEIGVGVIYSGGYVEVDWCPYESFPTGGDAQCIKPSGQFAWHDPNVPGTGCKKQYGWNNFQECGTWKVQVVVNGQVVGYHTFVIDVVQWDHGLTCNGGNGPCGQPACYKCSGTSCVQDNANGTLKTCNPNPCSSGNIYYKCENKVCNQKTGIGTSDCTPGQPCGNGNGGGGGTTCDGINLGGTCISAIYLIGGVALLMIYMTMTKNGSSGRKRR